jgi:peptidoglycan/LPS O-acetylase OafA/YrhL
MTPSFFEKFRRVTASTAYLPEIDGLRFLAVFWVAIIMHTTHYLNDKFYNGQLIKPGPWRWVILEGTHGMYLFFMISGFILSLPFAKAYLKDYEPINLKRYYLRRLTRLEPPYIIALFLFFLAHIIIVKKYAISQLIPSLMASIIYCHDLIYGQHSLVLPVAWSLEIEVQFYLLAPLFCLFFNIKSSATRRLTFLLIMVGGTYYFSYATPRLENLLRYLHYFMAGLLLADLYVSHNGKVTNSMVGYIIGIIALVVLLSIPSFYVFPMLLLKLIVLFVLFYQVLFNARMKAMFSAKGITLIGGMCYSIYLLHFGIISCFGTIMLSRNASFNSNHAPLYLIAITLLILLLSAAYYYYVEKPFMRFRVKHLEQKTKKEEFI